MLFTFPSRYWFAIGHVRVFRLGGWSPHVQTGFHVSRPTQVLLYRFRIRDCHPLWSNFPECSANLQQGTGLVRVRSPLLTESRLISFPPGTEMFQFPGFALHAYVFSMQYGLSRGFPHSDISGSKLVCQLPEDFAGYRVLHRLLPPRHPPRTLIRLTI